MSSRRHTGSKGGSRGRGGDVKVAAAAADPAKLNVKDKGNGVEDKEMPTAPEKAQQNGVEEDDSKEMKVSDHRGQYLQKDGTPMTTAEAIHFMDAEIQAVRDGTHVVLVGQRKGLEEKLEEQVGYATTMLQRRQDNVQELFNAEKKLATDEYEAELSRLQTEMLEQLQMKRRKLDSKLALRIQESGAVTRRKAGTGTGLLQPVGTNPAGQSSRKRSRIHFHKFKFSLSSEEIAHDVGAMKMDFVSWNSPNPDVQVEESVLSIKGVRIPLNGQVKCVQTMTGHTLHGELVDLSPLEVHVRRRDSLDIRIMLEQLRDESWTLSPYLPGQPDSSAPTSSPVEADAMQS